MRRRAKPFDQVTDKERVLVDQMLEIMRFSGGIGLAAPQVGLAKQLVIVDIGEGPVVLFNPRIEKKRGREAMEEGCLSLPGIYVNVHRAKTVHVSGLNAFGEKLSFSAYGLMARALQHEIDHLRGRLILDYAGFLKKLKLRKKLKSVCGSQE